MGPSAPSGTSWKRSLKLPDSGRPATTIWRSASVQCSSCRRRSRRSSPTWQKPSGRTATRPPCRSTWESFREMSSRRCMSWPPRPSPAAPSGASPALPASRPPLAALAGEAAAGDEVLPGLPGQEEPPPTGQALGGRLQAAAGKLPAPEPTGPPLWGEEALQAAAGRPPGGEPPGPLLWGDAPQAAAGRPPGGELTGPLLWGEALEAAAGRPPAGPSAGGAGPARRQQSDRCPASFWFTQWTSSLVLRLSHIS
mmetsp:Transcript_45541/g.131935  ORF Transcript_45541/g.131935 Transcript_45541/m.131935 type:complete len:253 (+) Transcript_45541:500-1258(+)